MFVALRVSKQLVTADHPVPVPAVQSVSAAGQLLHDVTAPPALYVAPVHCLQVKELPEPLTIEPAFAWNAVDAVAVFHVVASLAVFLRTPAEQ